MSNNHARWPDLVFAAVLLIAGLLMLRYGVWHLVHHREVVSPLLAGSGALVLGALCIRQVLRSRFAQARRYKRRHPAARTRWWFWAIVISASANGFASAQIAGATLSGIEMAPATSIETLPRKRDLDPAGHRGIGGDFKNVQSRETKRNTRGRLSAGRDQRILMSEQPVITQYLTNLGCALSHPSRGSEYRGGTSLSIEAMARGRSPEPKSLRRGNDSRGPRLRRLTRPNQSVQVYENE